MLERDMETINVIVDLRKDMKTLIATLQALNNHLTTLQKAVTVMEKLQKTVEANEGNLKKLIDEMEATNKNIDAVLALLKELK
jgi:cell division protein FtsB